MYVLYTTEVNYGVDRKPLSMTLFKVINTITFFLNLCVIRSVKLILIFCFSEIL